MTPTTLTTFLVAAALALAPAAHATPPARATGVEAQVAAAAARQLPAGLALTDVRVPRALAGAADAADVVVTFVTAPRAGRASVKVALRDAAGHTRAGWATLVVARVRTVLVAARALPAGATLAAGDVITADRPDGGPAGLELAPDALIGATLTDALAAGAALPAGAVTLPAPVARGAAVRVIVRRGAIAITARGTLERSARPGERVATRVAATDRVVEGRLVGADTVVVLGER